ncbi:HD-like signal output (HDOD) domain, no enzymatic activity [Cupriavidus sp. OV038]|jgi:HD-like signal output (HDOD) protein|uniref:HDOD domain-containing protein n=1 Tax=unclassified Cupriavidus TaxID=2640874 RepID=UPI0008F1BA09|nr:MULTISPECIES: HDOD domain-containing protein [unclassified Cupriavidus]SFC18448.1 HD-like signal output (HDOD) domain, no enzymatic activity [Cupriavidus sp. OV038]SFP13539.1 HD-like signal output (HDOD) domain, no enzymatic activity [Cupriavidus sp. OV096]
MTMLPKEQFFESLWTRMAQQGDFPTLQYCVDNIFQTLNGDLTVGEMATSVLSDFSLSQKVIRLANSAMYRSFGGEVTTVSRAILVLGVEAISHLTLGIQLLDYFHGVASQRPQATKGLQRALVAGEITRALSHARGINEGEEAVVCTLMHHMSRLLVVFYFPDEWERVEAMCATHPMTENEACQEVLGVSMEEIAEAAARKWRLPGIIAHAMKPRLMSPDTVLETHADWLAAIAHVSAQAAAAMVRDGTQESVQDLLTAHAKMLGLTTGDVAIAVRQADSLNTSITRAEAPAEAAAPAGASSDPEDMLRRLRQGLDEVRREGAGLSVSQLAPMVLETTMRAMNFSRCFLMMLNPATKRFHARLGFGEGMRDKLTALSFEEGFVPDVFHFAGLADKPLLIEDAFDPSIAHRIPRWYRDAMPDAKSILLAPVRMRNRCIALIYGDWGATRCAWELGEPELNAVDELMREIAAGVLRAAPQRAEP